MGAWALTKGERIAFYMNAKSVAPGDAHSGLEGLQLDFLAGID